RENKTKNRVKIKKKEQADIAAATKPSGGKKKEENILSHAAAGVTVTLITKFFAEKKYIQKGLLKKERKT
ncbi:hypothetical protein IscW_ISCW014197, partial [Ixodes scapularis]